MTGSIGVFSSVFSAVTERIGTVSPLWKNFFENESKKLYFEGLSSFLDDEYRSGKNICPPPDKIFRAFFLCPAEKMRVLILSQDPYPTAGTADGLAFSTSSGRCPGSLRNILKEIECEFGSTVISERYDLSAWAEQGVLLLNSVLTVDEGHSGSHSRKGWELFTDGLIKYISEKCSPSVFILLGNYAKEKRKLIDPQRHLILECCHPSPMSLADPQRKKDFFSSHLFGRASDFLEKSMRGTVKW